MEYRVQSQVDISEQLLPMPIIQDFLRMYDPHDEELLTLYRSAAISFASRYMNRSIGVATVMAYAESVSKRVLLPFGDVKQITTATREGANKFLI